MHAGFHLKFIGDEAVRLSALPPCRSGGTASAHRELTIDDKKLYPGNYNLNELDTVDHRHRETASHDVAKIVRRPESFRPELPFCFRRCSRRRVGRRYFRRIHPVRLEWQRAVNLHDRLALAHREMPHLLGYRNKIANVHHLQLRFIEGFAHAQQQGALQHGNVFIRRMPVRGDFRSVRASQTQDEGCSFSVQVAIHRDEIDSLDERHLLQILEMYNLVKTITHRCFSFYDQYLTRHQQRISNALDTFTDGALTNSKAVRVPELPPCERCSICVNSKEVMEIRSANNMNC